MVHSVCLFSFPSIGLLSVHRFVNLSMVELYINLLFYPSKLSKLNEFLGISVDFNSTSLD